MITKVKTNTSNYRKLAIRVRAKEACKNHVFDTCLPVELKIVNTKKWQQTNLGQRRDDWVAFLHTHPKIDNYSWRSERSNWQASSISQTSSHFYSWIWIICANRVYTVVCIIHIFLIFKTFLINKKTSLINISTPIMLSFSSFSEDLLFFKKVLENNVWNSKLDFAWWNLNQSYIPNLIMILKICIGKHSYHIVNTDRSENSEW